MLSQRMAAPNRREFGESVMFGKANSAGAFSLEEVAGNRRWREVGWTWVTRSRKGLLTTAGENHK